MVEDKVSTASGMSKCFKTVGNNDHLLVLQDDVLPCRDLLATANYLTEINPDNFISLYSANERVEHAMARHKSWLTINTAYGLCGYIIPKFMIEEYLFIEPKFRESVIADDVRLSVYLKLTGRLNWVTCPSLVEHICWHESITTGQSGIRNRVSNRYLGFERSGLDVDWLEGLEVPDHVQLASDTLERHLK